MTPRDYPICERCGHGPSEHSTSRCSHGPTAIFTEWPKCDCAGWKLDIGWKAAERSPVRPINPLYDGSVR